MRRRVYTTTQAELTPAPTPSEAPEYTPADYKPYGVTPELRKLLRAQAERDERARELEQRRRRAGELAGSQIRRRRCS